MENRVFAGRYRITEKIGTGGMAEVYKAQDETLGRTVAVKVMLPQYASDRTFAARFRQEAQAAANLSSPYIVNIYDWGQDEGTYFIVMEYIRGIDLKSAILQRGAINQRKVAEIGSQICSALSVAHGYDIIHRDIKPQNIMVQPDGNIKVMDFGIARAGNSNLTTTNSVLGTAHYVSPEQAQGKSLAATSDLYSLGVVLYESVTGKLPFDAPDAVSVAMKQVSEQPLPPSSLKPDLDPTLEAIILHAMEKNPENRFPSAVDMKNALNNYLAGRPVVLTSANATSSPTTVMSGVAPTAAATVQMPRRTMNPVDETAVMPTQERSYNTSEYQKPNRGVEKNYKNSSKNEKQHKSKGPLVAAIIIVIAVIALALGIMNLSNCSSSNSNSVTVPDVTGMTKSKAVDALTSAGLAVGTVTEQSSQTVTAGNVISQDPTAKKSVASGTKVNLVISTGVDKPSTVDVPDLSDMTASEAESALSALGLKYSAGSPQESDTVEKGKVMSQNPAAGTSVEVGSTVTYVLSTGKGNVSVPDVTGFTETAATNTLSGLDLNVSTSYTYSSTVSEGLVISQSVAGGTSVAAGSSITLTISKGAEPTPTVSVPDVTGQTLESATATLKALGFSVTSTGTGTVVASQSPAGGSSADQGSTITLTLKEASTTPTTPTTGN